MGQQEVKQTTDGTGATPLLVGIATDGFLARVGLPKAIHTTVGPTGLFHKLAAVAAEGPDQIVLGVYPSVQVAVQVYAAGLRRAARQLDRAPPTGIGDEFVCPVIDGRGTTWLRRANVILLVSWHGSREGAIALARKADEILLHDRDVCSWGDSVPIPDVELTAPERVALGSHVVVKYEVSDGGRVCAEGTPGLHSSGEAYYSADKLGKHRVEFRFGSATNVMFTKSIEIEVVPPEELVAAGALPPWTWRSGELYFIRSAEHGWESAPHEQREWLTLYGRGGLYGQPPGSDAWREDGLRDLAAALREEWLPTTAVMQAYRGNMPPHHRVYSAAFHVRECNMLAMGQIGRQFWLYLEQPDPLPAGRQPLTAADVFREELLAGAARGKDGQPSAGLMVRTFRRHRAYGPEGPYEPVHVLFAHVGFAEMLTLSSVGSP